MDALTTARALAAAHPRAGLPCPICAASLNAKNLERHLAKVHADATPGTAGIWRGTGWLGLFPCSVQLDGDALVLHHWLGLARRRVTLPGVIEAGGLVGTRLDPIMASQADEMNPSAETVRRGRYLRIVGTNTITIGCASNTGFSKHWDGWRQGGSRRSADVLVGREAMVAIEYALADRGLLTLAASTPVARARHGVRSTVAP